MCAKRFQCNETPAARNIKHEKNRALCKKPLFPSKQPILRDKPKLATVLLPANIDKSDLIFKSAHMLLCAYTQTNPLPLITL